MLVDFKGGATFLGLAGLPHVSAVITNLADELTLVDRMADALAGEINRRQEMLRAAGNLVSVTDYAAARRGGRRPAAAAGAVRGRRRVLRAARAAPGADRPARHDRPARALARDAPAACLAAARRGTAARAGVAPVLPHRAAHVLRGGVPGRARRARRAPAAVRARLGVPRHRHRRAGPVPRGVRVRSGHGAAARRAGAPHRRRPRAHPFRVAPIRGSRRRPSRRPRRTEDTEDGPTVLDSVIAAMAGSGPPAHRVWLPPLDDPPPLDEVLGPVQPVPGRGLAAPRRSAAAGRRRAGRPALPAAPRRARRRPGRRVRSPRRGRRPAVRASPPRCATTVLGLALTCTPDELGVHVLDFGGGALAALSGLPHVGTVADRQQPDLVRRIVAEFAAVLARRERLFREAGITSVEDFRARRAAGAFPDEPATDLLLVVDGYLDAARRVRRPGGAAAARSPRRACPTGCTSRCRPPAGASCGRRSRTCSAAGSSCGWARPRSPRSTGAAPPRVPARPGHGLAADGAPAVLAAPRLSADATDLPALVAAIAAAWPGPGFGAGPAAARADRPRRAAGRRAGRHGHPARRGRGAARACGARPRRRAAPAVLRRRGERQDRAAAAARARGRHGAPAGAGADRAGRPPAHAARRGPGLPPDRLHQHPGCHGGGRSRGGRVAAQAGCPDRTSRRASCASAAGGPGRRCTCSSTTTTWSRRAAARRTRCSRWWSSCRRPRTSGCTWSSPGAAAAPARALYDPVLGRLRELAAPGLVMNGSPDEGALLGNGEARVRATGARHARRPPARQPARPARLVARPRS